MASDADLWLLRAKSCLILSRSPIVDVIYLEDLCFQAQQAAEKAFKAVLVLENQVPPRTHDIAVLLKLCGDLRPVPSDQEESAELIDYAVRTRYPDDYQPIGLEQYERATELASRVVSWANEIIDRRLR